MMPGGCTSEPGEGEVGLGKGLGGPPCAPRCPQSFPSQNNPHLWDTQVPAGRGPGRTHVTPLLPPGDPSSPEREVWVADSSVGPPTLPRGSR